ncbi:uncharacterized protein F4822DRAFT_306579 [Hypoxylon trugodes]|uniref:uncharacterized protein n=1 Tax=Hypoxylon trugodes TaxID=326681 RepID=UPI0021A2021B|nr:uncharacterized protein F4822DRAFT_306579 [Hypoxylon trugodes]KAI1386147.1 hypothetical protein F4822DRAFT_306579 [Hypoxylon trugodes]
MERQTRRRRRPALSCLECRRRKIKCNRNEPCSHCVSAKLKCVYRVYSDEPTTDQQPHQSDSRGEAPGTSTRVPSIVGLTPTFTEHSQPSRSSVTSPSATVTATGGQSSTSNNLSQNNSQPPDRAQDYEPGLIGILQRGSRPEKLSANSPIYGLAETGQDILARQLGLEDSRIILNKTRILGWSLRIGSAEEFEPLVACFFSAAKSVKEDSVPDTELGAARTQMWTLLQKCKSIAKSMKVGRPSRLLSHPEIDLSPPSRDLADRMVTLYFQYFESTHRVLHAPTFWSEYQKWWDHPESTPASLRLKALLVIGIGSCLSSHEDKDPGFRNTVHQWIYAAQTWLAGPLEKDRLNIEGIQIYCLTILARQIFSIGGDLAWASVGSLIHMAMQMGLHRDPKHLPAMSILQAELRRRLWATILEMVLQSALDSAMLPRISLDDFDTEAPSNNNDDEIDESTTELQPHPKDKYTDASMQLVLLDLVPIRLRILKLLNGLNSELSYLDALALSSEIIEEYQACSKSTREGERSGMTPFHRNLLDYLVRRFLIPLHGPFATEARNNPLFYYSLKVSLDSALAIISPEPDECFSRLMAIGGGMFREGIRYATSVITRELIRQVKARRTDGTLHRNSQYIELLKQTVNDMNTMSIERIRKGETNVKSPMFLSMIMTYVEAIEKNTPYELAVAQSGRDSLEMCYNLLREKTGTISSPYPYNTGLTPRSLNGSYGFDLDLDWESFLPDADFS